MAVARFCTGMLAALDLPDRAVSVAFLGVREMRSVNNQYRGKDYATDVLSFPYLGVNMEGMPFLGEILIAPEVAVKQAKRYRVSPEKEIRKLLVHGILHLLGYDHETDRGQMNRIQSKLMRRRFFLSPPPVTDVKASQ